MAWFYSDRCRETGAGHTPYMLGHSTYSASTMDGNKRGVYNCKRWEELLGHGSYSAQVGFPRFAGDDLRGWLYRSEAFFERNGTPWDRKVTVAVVHLEGQALQWHHFYMMKRMTREMPLWGDYVQALSTRFGVTTLNDSWAERVTWRQTGERDECVETFDSLAGEKRPSHGSKIPLQVGSNPPAVLPISLKQQLPKNMGVIGMMASRSPTISEPVSELVRNDIMKGTINYYCSSEVDIGASNEKDCAVEVNTTCNGSKDEGANCAKQYSAEVCFADAMFVIESIRRDEFGLDSDLSVTESSMLRKQHARLGRALHSVRESTSPPVVLEKKKDKPGWLQPYQQRTLLMQNYIKPASLYYGHFLMLSQFESARIGMLKFYDLMKVLSDALKRNYYDSEPMRGKCGVTNDSNFSQAEGRVLPSLMLKVGNGEKLFPCTGRWNFNNRKLVEPTKIHRWTVVNFSARRDTRGLVRDLIKWGNIKGINIENPFDVFEENPEWMQTPPVVRMEKMFAEKQSNLPGAPQFLLCLLLERKNSDRYGDWKRKNLDEYGIVAQCIAPMKVNNEYLTNVLLEINAKLGRLKSMLTVEHCPSIPLVSKVPTIILGIDVSHAFPGRADIPSIDMGAGFLAMSAAKEIVGLEGSAIGNLWLDTIGKSLNEGNAFERMGSRQLAGLPICLWVRKELRTHVGDVDIAAVACGFLHTSECPALLPESG